MSAHGGMDKSDLTLSEILETDFLKCRICKAVYKNPKLLPCLHTFCQECIHKIIQIGNQSKEGCNQSGTSSNQSEVSLQNGLESKNTETGNDANWGETIHGLDINLLCPVCKSEVKLLKENNNGFPENSFLQDLCTMFNYKTDQKRHCEYCKFDGKTAPASHLCLDCHDNMCVACTAAHHRTKLTRVHKVIPYEQARKGLYDIDIRDYQVMTCIKHMDEHLSMFCEKCEQLICKQCKVENHDNHKWTDLTHAMVKYEIQMKNLLGGIQQQIPSVQKYIQFLTNYDTSLQKTREKMAEKILHQANTLHELIDHQKATFLQSLNEETDKERCLVQVKTGNLKTAAASLENNETFLRLLLHHGKPDEILSLHENIKHRLTQLSHLQMDGVSTRLKADFNNGSCSAKNMEIVFGKLTTSHEFFNHSDTGLASKNALQISNILPNLKNTPDVTQQFEAVGESDTKEVWPTGMAVTPDSDFVIVDRDNKIIKVHNKTGQLKQEIKGNGEQRLMIPFDVALLKSGDIAVTDHGAEDVKIFTTNGNHVLTIQEGIKYPRGITVNAKGEIITVDCQHRCLTVHDPTSGKLIKHIEATNNKGSKVLVDPYYIAVTAQGNLLVTDTAAPHIKFFSATGDYLANYGNYGVQKDQILQPYGICCDNYGYIFVCDNQNHRIHALLPDGTFCQFLLTTANSLWHPMTVATTPSGGLAVTEALGKVKVYNYM